MTIHDLIPLVFPHHYGWQHALYYKYIVRRALQRSERILTGSHSSKSDLMRYFNLDESKIAMTDYGVDDRFKPDDTGISREAVAKKFDVKGTYILSVVNKKPHKNVMTLIKAFQKRIPRSVISYQLVIVGISRELVQNDISDGENRDIIFLPQVTDDQLITLYQAASLFVLPTLYEGFGLPVLEAMACGTPVITSNVSSLPEVAGDAAILVDPNNIDELSQAIYNVLADSALQKELRGKGIYQARRFSWKETAQQTLRVYEEVLSSVVRH